MRMSVCRSTTCRRGSHLATRYDPTALEGVLPAGRGVEVATLGELVQQRVPVWAALPSVRDTSCGRRLHEGRCNSLTKNEKIVKV